MSVYEKNTGVLEKVNSGLYKKMQDFCVSDTKNIVDDTKLLPTREEQQIIVVSRNGREYRLGSAMRPTAEAKRWAEQFECGSENRVISVFGFASGLYAAELCERAGANTKILIYEPSAMLFDFVLKNFDITCVLLDPRVEVMIEDIDVLAFGEALLKYMDFFNIELQQTAVLPQYREMFSESYERFSKRLRESDERIMVNKNTLLRFNGTSVQNTFSNIPLLSNTNLAEELGTIVPRDIPVIIVSAGPSLDKNIEELKRAKGKAFILAVDTAIKYMLNHDIIPDATITVEPEKPLEHYENPLCDSIPLIFDMEANNEIVKRCNARKFLFNGRGYIKNLLEKLNIECTDTANGGSVATAAFALCYKLEFKHIILIGQDLAYGGTKTHAGGVESKGINNDIGYTMIEGIDGGEVRTRSDWLAYLRWFENAIAVMKDLKKDMKVYDATQGGALIHGTIVISLSEAIDKLCTRAYDFSAACAECRPMLDADGYEKLMKLHQIELAGVKKIGENAKGILPLCDEICGFLEGELKKFENAADVNDKDIKDKDTKDKGIKDKGIKDKDIKDKDIKGKGISKAYSGKIDVRKILNQNIINKMQRVTQLQKACTAADIYPLLNNYAVSLVASDIQKLYGEAESEFENLFANYKRTRLAFEALGRACDEILKM